MLPCVCSLKDQRWHQNGWEQKCDTWSNSWVCHWCSYHILTSSVILYWTDTQQCEMNLLVLHSKKRMFNPLTLGAFCQKHVFWTFWWFSGWTSAKLALLVKKAIATPQFALLASSITFYDILARLCAKIKILRRESDLRLSAFQFL